MESPFDIEIYKRECLERGVAPLKASALQHPEESWAYRVAASLPKLLRDEASSSPSTQNRGQNKKRKINVQAARQQRALQVCTDLAARNHCALGTDCRKSHDVLKRRQELLDLTSKGAALQDCPWLTRNLPCPYGINCFAALDHTDEQGRNLMPPKLEPSRTDESTSASSGGTPREDTDVSSLPVPVDNSSGEVESESEILPVGETPGDGETPVEDPSGRRVVTAEDEMLLDECMNKSKTIIAQVKAANLHHRVKAKPSDKEGPVCMPPSKVDVEEKRDTLKKLLKGKSILAPLTTVGNLPFRRLCLKFGVDCTMSEMILATSVNSLKQCDLALLKRHQDEKIFGIQVAGGYADQLKRCGEIFEATEMSCDWIDINMGCPLDGLTKRGAGCALMHREKHLSSIIHELNSVTTKPVSVKMRTACLGSDTNTAHLLIPKMLEWGASGISVHGRSAKQRYLREADWGYIRECQQAVDGRCNFTGNGDLFSPEEIVKVWETSQADSVMIGRGALIKPWVFSELKSGKLWDISSMERFDMLKDFCHFGLEHWGSDGKGVETTRRFLLEQMSFLHRYIPVGLLEVLPQKLNWRGSDLKGRDELETLMARSDVKSWIELSERLLGKAPDDFCFVPKHKSHACEVEG